MSVLAPALADPLASYARARRRARRLLWLALGTFAAGLSGAVGMACAPAARARSPAPPAEQRRAPEPAANGLPMANAAPPPDAAPAPHAAPTPDALPERCGPFECRWFSSGADALGFVLAEAPVALGIGEAHALAGTEHLPSTARRFSEELLPSLAGQASHLVVELLNPDPRCPAAAREVRRAQEPVTAPQSKQNQSDYVELGTRARALGIQPFVLTPTCDELRAIAEAGEDAVARMLATIARVTSRMLRAALAKNRAQGRAGLVIGYGGALHNDIAPSEQKRAWSYGPDLLASTGGRYVELDLIVREFIKDNEAWRALPWYAHFDPARGASQFLVMRTAGHRYALFFPKASASR